MKFRCHSGHHLLWCVLGLIWQKVLIRCISPRFEYGLNWAVLCSSAWPLRWPPLCETRGAGVFDRNGVSAAEAMFWTKEVQTEDLNTCSYGWGASSLARTEKWAHVSVIFAWSFSFLHSFCRRRTVPRNAVKGACAFAACLHSGSIFHPCLSYSCGFEREVFYTNNSKKLW